MLRAFLGGAVFGTVTEGGEGLAVLLHGWRRTREDFDEVARELATLGMGAVAIDLPGFGATPPPVAPMGARGYATTLAPLVAELADAHGPVVLVGHSFGGRVAACLAAADASPVKGVVLSGVPLIRSAMPHSAPSIRYRCWREAARLHLVPASQLERVRRRYGSADYRAASGVVRGVLVASVSETYEAELEAIRCGVSLVWGERDTTVPVDVAWAAQRHAPKATVEVLAAVGHLVPTEAPAQLAKAAALLGGAG
ncbi:MAG TPA: alpha/beta fold hydrolase [Acidimicrobiales bacterium]